MDEEDNWNDIKCIHHQKSKRMADEPEDQKIVWESVNVTPEEVAKQLNEREGGRKAGRGDSPYTQEFYEETYGIDSKKNGKK